MIFSLNPEPTPAQWLTYRRHRKAGTSPGNPRWYRNSAFNPFVFKPNQPPQYPRFVSRPTNGEWRRTIIHKRPGEPFE
jgi:hypothetical protein